MGDFSSVILTVYVAKILKSLNLLSNTQTTSFRLETRMDDYMTCFVSVFFLLSRVC